MGGNSSQLQDEPSLFINLLVDLGQNGNTSETEKGHVDADGASGILRGLVATAALLLTTVNTLVGLLVVGLALGASLDGLGLLEIEEEVAEIGDIGRGLNVDGSLDILKSRELDPRKMRVRTCISKKKS